MSRARWPRLSIAAGALAALAVACLIWWHIVLWLAWLLVAAVILQRTRARGPLTSLLASAALLYVLFLAVRVLPAALHQRADEYRSDASYASFQESEAATQRRVGVDPEFVTFVGRRLTKGDTFYVSTESPAPTAAVRSWLQFELLPSIEKYGSPCEAKWVVFYASTQLPPGLVVEKLVTYRPGYALGLVGSPCTP